jgi:hypothetical protein
MAYSSSRMSYQDSNKKPHLKIHFSGGSAVDFMIAKSSLIMAFKSEKCYDYVDPNAGPHIAVADGGRGTAVLGAAIVEDMYTPVTAPDIGAPVPRERLFKLSMMIMWQEQPLFLPLFMVPDSLSLLET